jgi:hypothetical protein
LVVKGFAVGDPDDTGRGIDDIEEQAQVARSGLADRYTRVDMAACPR